MTTDGSLRSGLMTHLACGRLGQNQGRGPSSYRVACEGAGAEMASCPWAPLRRALAPYRECPALAFGNAEALSSSKISFFAFFICTYQKRSGLWTKRHTCQRANSRRSLYANGCVTISSAQACTSPASGAPRPFPSQCTQLQEHDWLSLGGHTALQPACGGAGMDLGPWGWLQWSSH